MDVHPATSKLHSQSYNSQSELRTKQNKKYVNTKSAKKWIDKHAIDGFPEIKNFHIQVNSH